MRNKYQFDNVLVANLELHLARALPQVLVLNSKLNKCSDPASTCASCCLSAESAEFRRRSDVAPTVPDCFATCGQRRALNVELQARSQLSGKLLILGLTKIAANRTNYACQPLQSWTFTRFQPADPLADGRHLRQSFFARTDQQQVAAYSISSLDISWRADGERREQLALSIRPGESRVDEPTGRETLLVNELECRPTGNASRPVDKLSVHLMTLINRTNSSRSSQVVAGSSSKQLPTELPASAPTIDHQVAAPWPPRRRAITDAEPAQRAAELLGPTMHNNETNRNQRPHPAGPSTSSSIGPSYLLELDALGLRLRSSSLLILLASSSFVILTYTICLLVCLRRASRRSKKLAGRPGEPSDKQVLNISSPFNLQMPPATRTRLEMMLRNKRKNRQRSKRDRRPPPDSSSAGLGRARVRWDGEPEAEQNKRATFHCRPFRWDAYGTLSAVAASLTRSSRSRNMRYRPNLNVIPESDLESQQQQQQQQQQQLHSEHLDAEKSEFANPQDQASALYSSLQLSPDSYLASLVEDAMSLECSHTFERTAYNQETLFARPIEQTATSTQSDESAALILSSFDPISRSRILRQVKQQDSKER